MKQFRLLEKISSVVFSLSAKTAIVLFLTLIMQAQAKTNAQTITLVRETISIRGFLQELRKQTGFNVVYESELINKLPATPVNAVNAPASSVLKTILSPYNLTFVIEGKTIAIRKAEHTAAAIAVQPAELTITGKVLDDTGKPLPEAIIRVKGSNKVFRANLAGEFSFKAAVGDVLTFNFIGFNPVTHTVKNDKPLTITLTVNSVSLGNVVVNGIFERKTNSYTGSAQTLQTKDIQNVSNTNLLSALAVLDPSIQIPQNIAAGSDPNRAADMRLRGASSIPTTSVSTSNTSAPGYGAYGKYVDQIANSYQNNPNLPLFILDGFEVTIQQINDLDLTTIKSVTILKDASSTAIYGSRGANGVIVIERYRPEGGKMQFNYKADFTLTLPDLSDYKLLNSSEKLQAEVLAGVYKRTDPAINQGLQAMYNERLKEVQRGRDFYWLSLPLRNTIGQRHGMTMDGTAGEVGYGLDFTYNDIEGVMKGSNRETFNGSVYLNYKGKKFSLNNRVNVQFANANNSNWGSFSEYTQANPYFTPFDDNGNIKLYLQQRTLSLSNSVYGNIYNPAYNSTLNGRNYTKSKTLINNTAFTYNFNEALSLRGRLSLTSSNNDQGVFLPAAHTSYRQTGTDLLQRGAFTAGYGKQFSYDGNIDLNYNKTVGKHALNSTLSARAYHNNYENVMVQVQGLPSPLTDYIFYGRQYVGSRPGGSEATTRTLGFLGNVNYTYDRRYFADFSYRLDGSSSLGSDRLFAPFWSLGLGWNLHYEKFAAKLVENGTINQFRIRGSLGMTGSQQFDPYMSYRTYNYFLNEAYAGSVGAALLGIGNDELKWQSTMKHNLGLDLTLFHNRITFTGDIYYDYTDKFIADFSLPLSTGFETYKGNLGAINSKGWEVRTTIQAVRSNDPRGFSLNLIGNMAYNVTTIDKINDALKSQNQKLQSSTGNTNPFTRYEEGSPINSLWVVPSLGIDPATGRELYLKQDGSATYKWDAQDMRNFGVSDPKYRGALGFTANYKGFQLNTYFSYYFGGQQYNRTLINRVENVNLVNNADRRVLTERWQKPGDQARFTAISSDGSSVNASSRFVQNDNTIELSSLSLLYKFNPKILKSMKVRQLNVGLYTNNLFRISTIAMERGLDYPFARSFSLSLQAGF